MFGTSSSPIQRSKRCVFVVSLEGLIGCGKSTQLELLKERYANDDRVTFVDEPVDAWNDLGILNAMYNGTLDKGMFQLTALMTRIAPIMIAMHSDAKVIVTERSWISDFLVFARANLRQPVHNATYHYTFLQLQAALEHLVLVDVSMLYLRCPVPTAVARMRERARDAESSVATEYMQTLYALHEQMITDAKTGQLTNYCRINHAGVPPQPPGMMTTAVVIDCETTNRAQIHEIITNNVEASLRRAECSAATAYWQARQLYATAAAAAAAAASASGWQTTIRGPRPCEDSRQASESSC